MITVKRKTVTAASLAAVAIFGAAACSSEEAASTASSATSAASSAVESATGSSSSPTSAAADPAANLIGSGCAAYAEQVPSGPGSVAGMSADPVTVAASNNPMLKTLTQALSGQLNPNVNLVDTLNGSEFTVFAPTDDAFAKIDPATIEKLKTDSNLLTSILTYHVVPGQAAPDAVAGEHKTVQGANLNVTGAGNDLKVNDAGLVCGGVKTANATVYMIDTVLMPPAA
ncbi:fasciclin domain-containing protein [Mycolicibacterium obuense]|uniref:Cell surface lipoprotein MPB83 n=1 Tax=Mycolicibacterium obuense TaxID=1807 RepID=A0A0J6VG37_9MYCO|nr:fasciclin domain-containing protein [Mycolicibacterium obuense]MBX7455684.1 fasciclin domain-containing protein [Mycolicibacterium aurantiacum]OKH71082.1 fasciclin [Mycobacterium sp. SWH-M1]KKF01568.1 fasciclin [Mycolicibacterium obuense]KMO68438.1 Cell surface lipoprotein MPB83 precursor [Mycolicibacterium obuense]TDL09632.1 fasciclin domain-containing protein [Mycolicibacterium obuense]